ncbi:MAG: LptF/LptG family permease [Kiritimatiellae bacterium]|nr:LptF/LptG family permease [Kiritimatiellia bacterium]
MKTLHRYVLSNFLVTFVMAMAVLTFVMTVGLVFSSMKYVARGMSPEILLQFLWQSLPGTLSYSVPVASLVASLLVFSRLSSDSEISAMRACGVPLRSIMRMPVLLSLFLAFACLWVNDDVSPDASFSRSMRRHTFRAGDVTALVQPLEWFETDDYSIYVSDRHGNTLLDLRVLQPLPDGRLRDVRAREAVIRPADAEGPLRLDMRDVKIATTSHDTGPSAARSGGDKIEEMRADAWTLPLSALSEDGGAARKSEPGRLHRRTKDLPTWALLRDIRSAAAIPPSSKSGRVAISRAKAEVASRAVLALACLCFVLIGIPLGIQSHRRQSSVGLAISLAVAGAFYLFCITGQSLAKHPGLHAHLLVVAPAAVCLVLAAYLISRND